MARPSAGYFAGLPMMPPPADPSTASMYASSTGQEFTNVSTPPRFASIGPLPKRNASVRPYASRAVVQHSRARASVASLGAAQKACTAARIDCAVVTVASYARSACRA